MTSGLASWLLEEAFSLTEMFEMRQDLDASLMKTGKDDQLRHSGLNWQLQGYQQECRLILVGEAVFGKLAFGPEAQSMPLSS